MKNVKKKKSKTFLSDKYSVITLQKQAGRV